MTVQPRSIRVLQRPLPRRGLATGVLAWLLEESPGALTPAQRARITAALRWAPPH